MIDSEQYVPEMFPYAYLWYVRCAVTSNSMFLLFFFFKSSIPLRYSSPRISFHTRTVCYTSPKQIWNHIHSNWHKYMKCTHTSSKWMGGNCWCFPFILIHAHVSFSIFFSLFGKYSEKILLIFFRYVEPEIKKTTRWKKQNWQAIGYWHKSM